MSHNNRKWYTVFVKPQYTDQEWEILMHIRGEGNANIIILEMQKHYENRLRTLEGKINEISDSVKARYL